LKTINNLKAKRGGIYEKYLLWAIDSCPWILGNYLHTIKFYRPTNILHRHQRLCRRPRIRLAFLHSSYYINSNWWYCFEQKQPKAITHMDANSWDYRTLHYNAGIYLHNKQ